MIILVTSAIMTSFSFGSLMATSRAVAARALFDVRLVPPALFRMPFLARKVTNRAAAVRLLPSTSG
ncbi:hypothetical protein ASG45_06850 [Microbacterium sp. Leaf436]|nr:hypothetical protein ASG45_06850 [Microbacterium sp. Leaf436]